MFLQILRPFESLSTKVAFVRFQWDVDPNVRRDVIALDRGGATRVPSTRQIKVVCRLASDMLLTDVFL